MPAGWSMALSRTSAYPPAADGAAAGDLGAFPHLVCLRRVEQQAHGAVAVRLSPDRFQPVRVQAVVGTTFLVGVEHSLAGALPPERHPTVDRRERVGDPVCSGGRGSMFRPPVSDDIGTAR